MHEIELFGYQSSSKSYRPRKKPRSEVKINQKPFRPRFYLDIFLLINPTFY